MVMARFIHDIQADISSLEAVMASGVLSVSFADRRIQYNSYAEQQKALSRLRAELLRATKPRQKALRYFGFYQGR
jgi:hypothetical protein